MFGKDPMRVVSTTHIAGTINRKIFSSFLYLGLGPILWILYWPKFYISLIAIFLFLIVLFAMWKKSHFKLLVQRPVRNILDSILGIQFLSKCLVSLVISFFIGFGPFSKLSGDWIAARWELYTWLSYTEWPSTSLGLDVLQGQPGVIRSYLGFFLPPSGFVKILDSAGLETSYLTLYAALWVWVLIGLYIIVDLAFEYLRSIKKLIIYTLLFFCLPGLNIIGAVITKGIHSDFWEYSWWSGSFNFLPNIISFSYPTNTTLAVALGLLLLHSVHQKSNEITLLVFLFCFLAFWSIFIVPSFALIVLAQQENFKNFMLRILLLTKSRIHFSALFVFALLYLFVLYRFFSMPPIPVTAGLVPASNHFLENFLAFQLLSVIPILVLLRFTEISQRMRLLFSIVLPILPLFKIGAANDLNTKGAMPFLFIASYFLIKLFLSEISNLGKSKVLLIALTILFSVGSISFISEVTNKIVDVKDFKATFSGNNYVYQLYSGALSEVPCLAGASTYNKSRCPSSGALFANKIPESAQYWAYPPKNNDESLFRFSKSVPNFPVEINLELKDLSSPGSSQAVAGQKTSNYEIRTNYTYSQRVYIKFLSLANAQSPSTIPRVVSYKLTDQNSNEVVHSGNFILSSEILGPTLQLQLEDNNFYNLRFSANEVKPGTVNLQFEPSSYSYDGVKFYKLCQTNPNRTVTLYNSNFPCLYEN